MAFIWVFVGAGLGGVLRYAVSLAPLIAGRVGVAALLVNVLGGFVMGWLGAHLARIGVGETWRLFLLTGMLGGFTTFSAFSADAIALVERGAMGAAFVYVVASVVLSLAALAFGAYLVRG